MAVLKLGLDYFPLWKPQNTTEYKFHNINFKTKYKALRNSSSSFIHRDDVRNILLLKYNNKCVLCDSNDDLEVHHIIPVYFCAKGLIEICKLNTLENLIILCGKCHRKVRMV